VFIIRACFALLSTASLCLAQVPADDAPPPPGSYDEPNVTYVEQPPGIEAPAPGAVRRREPQPATVETRKTDDAPRGPRISMLDARTDWMAAVQLFVKRNAVEGVWSVRDAKGNAWRLKLTQVRGETVRERQPGQYAGLASCKSVGGRSHRVEVEFVVDLAGGEPTVTRFAVKKIVR